jgi:hypothetical protein
MSCSDNPSTPGVIDIIIDENSFHVLKNEYEDEETYG